MNTESELKKIIRPTYRFVRRFFLNAPKAIFYQYNQVLNYLKIIQIRRKDKISLGFIYEQEAIFHFWYLIEVILEQESQFNLIIINLDKEKKLNHDFVDKKITIIDHENYNKANICIDILMFSRLRSKFKASEFDIFVNTIYKKSIKLFHPYAVFQNKDFELNYDTWEHLSFFRFYLSIPLKVSYLKKLSHKGKLLKLTGHLSWESKPIKKIKEFKKRIIWTPHHTISINSPNAISTFEFTSQYMLNIVKDYSSLDFILKPHPVLYSYYLNVDSTQHSIVKKVFDEWINNINCKIEIGDFKPLFKNALGIINDSVSFIFLAHMYDKPIIMLKNKEKKYEAYLDDNGMIALNLCYEAYTESDIREKIELLIHNKLKSRKKKLFSKIVELKNLENPSKLIIKDLNDILKLS